tara:strand:+ start:405 stop:959 length:555 start_codon:yes stop_codon:yes gene_type:complete
MTILSENLRVIREGLNYTQMSLAEALGVGFRTYVRYEAGQKDAPVAILFQISRLSRLSLDRILTTRINGKDLQAPDLKITPASSTKLSVIGGSLGEGRLVFKGIQNSFLVSTDENEKKLLTLYRKMDTLTRKKCLMDFEWLLKSAGRKKPYHPRKAKSKNAQKATKVTKLKKLTQSIRKTTVKG